MLLLLPWSCWAHPNRRSTRGGGKWPRSKRPRQAFLVTCQPTEALKAQNHAGAFPLHGSDAVHRLGGQEGTENLTTSSTNRCRGESPRSKRPRQAFLVTCQPTDDPYSQERIQLPLNDHYDAVSALGARMEPCRLRDSRTSDWRGERTTCNRERIQRPS